jgi:hypothetical protein
MGHEKMRRQRHIMNMKTRDRYVYALYAGQQEKPCYIGIGKGKRLYNHMQEARRGFIGPNPRKCRALIACVRRGIPVIARKIASDLTIAEACAMETAFVLQYGRRGLDPRGCLLNAAEGGFGVRNPLPSTRLKKSLGMRGRTFSEETLVKMRLAAKNRPPPSAVTKAKLSLAGRGRKHRPQTLAKMKAAALNIPPEIRAKIAEAGRYRSPEFAAKMSQIASSRSPETKARIGAGRIGTRHSAETRACLAEIARNRAPISLETRAKMSAGSRRFWKSASIEKRDKMMKNLKTPPNGCCEGASTSI